MLSEELLREEKKYGRLMSWESTTQFRDSVSRGPGVFFHLLRFRFYFSLIVITRDATTSCL